MLWAYRLTSCDLRTTAAEYRCDTPQTKAAAVSCTHPMRISISTRQVVMRETVSSPEETRLRRFNTCTCDYASIESWYGPAFVLHVRARSRRQLLIGRALRLLIQKHPFVLKFACCKGKTVIRLSILQSIYSSLRPPLVSECEKAPGPNRLKAQQSRANSA
jgi:hypothetical protein